MISYTLNKKWIDKRYLPAVAIDRLEIIMHNRC